jgi:hypothetical protein
MHDGVRHSAELSCRTRPVDEYSHAAYWQSVDIEDPCPNEKASFAMCGATCASEEHDQVCLLEILAAPHWACVPVAQAFGDGGPVLSGCVVQLSVMLLDRCSAKRQASSIRWIPLTSVVCMATSVI